MIDDAAQGSDGAACIARGFPELLAEIQIEGDHGAGGLGSLHGLDDQLAGGRRERCEDAPAVEPSHAARKDRFPIEIPGLEQRPCFVRAIVENHRRAYPKASIAVDGGHVGPGGPVVLEGLIEGADTGGAHPLGDQVADRIVDHGADNGGLHAKAVGKIGGDIELAAAYVDLTIGGFPKGNDARLEAMDQSANRGKIERGLRKNVQNLSHRPSHSIARQPAAPARWDCSRWDERAGGLGGLSNHVDRAARALAGAHAATLAEIVIEAVALARTELLDGTVGAGVVAAVALKAVAAGEAALGLSPSLRALETEHHFIECSLTGVGSERTLHRFRGLGVGMDSDA